MTIINHFPLTEWFINDFAQGKDITAYDRLFSNGYTSRISQGQKIEVGE
jgi:hypothetical protein